MDCLESYFGQATLSVVGLVWSPLIWRHFWNWSYYFSFLFETLIFNWIDLCEFILERLSTNTNRLKITYVPQHRLLLLLCCLLGICGCMCVCYNLTRTFYINQQTSVASHEYLPTETFHLFNHFPTAGHCSCFSKKTNSQCKVLEACRCLEGPRSNKEVRVAGAEREVGDELSFKVLVIIQTWLLMWVR